MAKQMGSHTMTLDECIKECTECHQTCLRVIDYCLEKGGEHASPAHIRMLLDCAQSCQNSADFMLRVSPFHALTCFVCSEVCDACADHCERFEGDRTMQQCAEICRDCAESCRMMAEQAGISIDQSS